MTSAGVGCIFMRCAERTNKGSGQTKTSEVLLSLVSLERLADEAVGVQPRSWPGNRDPAGSVRIKQSSAIINTARESMTMEHNAGNNLVRLSEVSSRVETIRSGYARTHHSAFERTLLGHGNWTICYCGTARASTGHDSLRNRGRSHRAGNRSCH